jgi:transposase
MWRDLNITKQDWERTPAGVRTVLLSLQQQGRLLLIRCTAYEKEIAALRQQVTQIDDLKAEMAELRERLRQNSQNSQNSSKPPSSDPPSQRTKSTSEPTGRKRGGQFGHTGHGRQLKLKEEVDQIVELRPISCAQCGHLLLGDDPQPARHQVSEVPRAKAEVTEYRRHTLTCVVCGASTQAEWPEEMPPGVFGPRAQAVIGYLTGRLGASHRDVTEVMEVLHGLELSVGSVSAAQRQVSEALAEPVAEAQQFVQQQRAQYVDETGWPEGEQQKWLWINATADVTTFQALPGRGAAEAKKVISESAKGIITSDRLAAYNWLEERRRQVCWAHLKRDFQAVAEREGDSTETGQALLEQVKEVFTLWHQVRNGTLSRVEFQVRMEPVQQQVKELLQAGSRSTHPKTRHTCQNILKLWESLWTFVRVEGVEPTNNNAERPLRRAVIWRRKSFGTQSESGSRFVERILTVVTTLRQQGRDVLGYLTTVCTVASVSASSPCLLPDSS